MGRQPCCDKVGLKRGPWTIEEDHKLMNFILNNGIQCWRMVPKLAGLLRCGKSCRLRWINYLRPDLKRGAISESEENQIIELHARLGNRWSKIASHFPGRTDNEIKNQWNTRIKKRLKQLGLDPVTHKPLEQREKMETITEINSENEQEKLGPTCNNLDVKYDEENVNRNAEVLDIETDNLIKNYDMLCGSLDMGLWIDQENRNPCSSSANNTVKCYSPSFSIEDSVNPSAGESSSVQEDYSLQQWVESVDSMLPWNGFNQLDHGLFFPDTRHQ